MFQSCHDVLLSSEVKSVLKHRILVKCLAQGHSTVTVSGESRTSDSFGEVNLH